MLKCKKKQFILAALALGFGFGLKAQQRHFTVRQDNFILLGHETYKSLSFGQTVLPANPPSNPPQNGFYSIAAFNGGLNFWRPWPNATYGNYVLFLRSDMNVGIRTVGTSAFALDVNGRIRCSSISTSSDARLKTEVKTLSPALGQITRLRPISYRLLPRPNTSTTLPEGDWDETMRLTAEADAQAHNQVDSQVYLGLIAQELREIYPELVYEDENGLLSVNYVGLVPVLIMGMQEQQAQLQALKTELERLKK